MELGLKCIPSIIIVVHFIDIRNWHHVPLEYIINTGCCEFQALPTYSIISLPEIPTVLMMRFSYSTGTGNGCQKKSLRLLGKTLFTKSCPLNGIQLDVVLHLQQYCRIFWSSHPAAPRFPRLLLDPPSFVWNIISVGCGSQSPAPHTLMKSIPHPCNRSTWTHILRLWIPSASTQWSGLASLKGRNCAYHDI